MNILKVTSLPKCILKQFSSNNNLGFFSKQYHELWPSIILLEPLSWLTQSNDQLYLYQHDQLLKYGVNSLTMCISISASQNKTITKLNVGQTMIFYTTHPSMPTICWYLVLMTMQPWLLFNEIRIGSWHTLYVMSNVCVKC